MTRNPAAGIAGLSFLACIAIVAIALLQHALLVYGPDIRAFLLWAADPRTGIGLVLGMGVAVVAGLTVVRGHE